MSSSANDKPAGPLHKLRSAFKEIFGKQNDTPKSNAPDHDEKSDSSERERISR